MTWFSWFRKPAPPLGRRAFDVSNWWHNPVPDVDARKLMAGARALGYEVVMCETYEPVGCAQQVQAAVASGLFADLYVYLYFDANPAHQVIAASKIPCTGLTWLDCEEEPVGSPADVVATLKNLENIAWSAGLRPAIYTRPEWWKIYTGNSQEFKHLALWVADPDGKPLLDAAYWKKNGFGGWVRPTWKQYAFDQNLAGMNVDLSIGWT